LASWIFDSFRWAACDYPDVESLTIAQFEFKGTAYKSGRMPVFVHERGVKQIQEIIDEEETGRKEAQAWSEGDYDDIDCRGGYGHTKQCQGIQEFLRIECAADEADNANKSLKAVQTLRDVLKNSAKILLANGEDMIIALKRQNCLYDL
jgi:hypothetical protein